jgi:hypothetical protein
MSTYKINSNKKTKNSPTIVDHQSNGVEIANFATPTLSKRPIVEGLPALNTVLTKNEVDKRQPFKSGNRFMSTQEYLGNTSIFNGVYRPYLPVYIAADPDFEADNWYIETISSDVFYTTSVDQLLSRDYNNKDFIKIANSHTISFSMGATEKRTSKKINTDIKPSMIFGDSVFTEEEINSIENAIAGLAQSSFSSQSQTEYEEYKVMSSHIMRYVAETPEGCGYCVELLKQPQGLSVELQTGVSFPSGDGPVNNEEGFPLVASSCAELEQYIADTLASYSGTSIELGYPIVWSFTYEDGSTVTGEGCDNFPDDIALAYSHKCGDIFPENIDFIIARGSDTNDDEDECRAYEESAATSGCYEWVSPGAGFSRVNVDDIPAGYAYCSEEFIVYE